MNILIAEDDFISRKLLTNVLKDLGHEVTAASDGEEAWRMYETCPTRIVISDWLMPRMDGLDLVRKIRSHPKSEYSYIIMLTANVGQRENYFRAMEAGADDFLAKPLDRIELSIRLEVAQRILKATSRIQSLENVLTICAYTKKINIPEEGWQTIEEFMRRHLGLTLSHGIEPDYYQTVLKPQIEQLKRASAPRPSEEPKEGSADEEAS
jgi:DNA-binding response OmpR family regulator